MKKRVPILLALVLILGMCPLPVQAQQSGNVVASGKTDGETDWMNWTLYDTGLLEISGSGYMNGCSSWYPYSNLITQVIIHSGPNGITQRAFMDCQNLVSISLPETITFIGANAFSGCARLTAITLPDSCTEIYNQAFQYCSSLTTVTMGSGMTYIGNNAFSDCYRLAHVYYKGTQAQWNQIEVGSGNEALTAPIIHWESDGPGENVNTSGECGTEGSNVTWVLKDGVLTISGSGEMASYSYDTPAPWYPYNSQIREVVIEYGVTSIGGDAFYRCNALTHISIPESVTYIGWGAFYKCTALTSVILPSSLTSIGSHVFYECTSLRSITIPSIVTSIGSNAFDQCRSLATVYISGQLTSVDRNAFRGCTGLNKVCYSGSKAQWEQITLGGGNEHLSGASLHCLVSDPDGKLLASGFCGAEGANISWAGYSNGLLEFSGSGDMSNFNKAGAPWYGGTALWEVVIEDGITSIGDHCFYESRWMSEISIPDSVVSIGDRAFYACRVPTITLPDNLTYIGEYAFAYTYFSTITIPDTLTSLSEGVFFGSRLTSVDFGSGLTSIGRLAFYASNLTSVTFPDRFMELDESSFENCDNLTEVTISNASIGKWAFSEIDNLTSVTIGKECPAIGERAFADCRNLTDATIHSPEVGTLAFGACYKLTNLTLGSSVTVLGDQAFRQCGLTSVTIPRSVTTIGNEVFYRGKITDLYYEGTREQWEEISMGTNEEITNATIHFNDAHQPDYGDVNCDGRINALDLIVLRQSLAGWDVAADPLASDVNGDGRINPLDLVVLRQNLAGWDVPLGPR